MTKREKIRAIYQDLKYGLRMCETIPTKNLSGEVVGYHQGLTFSCDGEYLYFLSSGSWARKASQKRLAEELEMHGCDLDMIVSESEFEEISGRKFFGWRI